MYRVHAERQTILIKWLVVPAANFAGIAFVRLPKILAVNLGFLRVLIWENCILFIRHPNTDISIEQDLSIPYSLCKQNDNWRSKSVVHVLSTKVDGFDVNLCECAQWKETKVATINKSTIAIEWPTHILHTNQIHIYTSIRVWAYGCSFTRFFRHIILYSLESMAETISRDLYRWMPSHYSWSMTVNYSRNASWCMAGWTPSAGLIGAIRVMRLRGMPNDNRIGLKSSWFNLKWMQRWTIAEIIIIHFFISACVSHEYYIKNLGGGTHFVAAEWSPTLHYK